MVGRTNSTSARECAETATAQVEEKEVDEEKADLHARVVKGTISNSNGHTNNSNNNIIKLLAILQETKKKKTKIKERREREREH